MKTYLAVDLGAGSGRVMAGHFDGRTIKLEEVARFSSAGVNLPDGSHWAVLQLFTAIKDGLAKGARQFGDSVVSVAVDSWGVDYGLLNKRGTLLGFPWMYRDPRTDGMMEKAYGLVPKEEIYERTGVQFMFFNTIYQLLAEREYSPETLSSAESLLFIPDLITYWLSGEQKIERTIASTSQLLRAGSADWDHELIARLGLPDRIFRPTVEPGVKVGALLPSVASELGSHRFAVSTTGGHDTASAVAGIPARSAQPLFLSSGTWSLIGRELNQPLVTPETFAAGFSNEQGLCGTTRFLKNIGGMWLLQECQRQWKESARDYGTLVQEAASARSTAIIDPDAPELAKPDKMVDAIQDAARRSGQVVPETHGEIARCVFESLARKYREILAGMRAWMPDLPDTLHIVGGGSQNHLLNQMTADATGLQVVAGPVEATAAGNVLGQLMADGEIASLEEGREILRTSFEPRVFEPQSSTVAA